MNTFRKFVICLTLFAIFWSFTARFSKKVLAQVTSSGVAISIPVEGDLANGSILCSSTEKITACETEYDPSIIGVLVKNPPVALESTGDEGEALSLYLSDGVAQVRVSTQNGKLEEGNAITSSTLPGVGMLADRSSYILGNALEPYTSDDPESVGTILVALNIHPAAGLTAARSDLVEVLRSGLTAPFFEPLNAFRYLLAVVIILISFSLGFLYFGRVSKTGVEAIGRNPLASRMIYISMILNILTTIVIVLVGLVIAYLILIF